MSRLVEDLAEALQFYVDLHDKFENDLLHALTQEEDIAEWDRVRAIARYALEDAIDEQESTIALEDVRLNGSVPLRDAMNDA